MPRVVLHVALHLLRGSTSKTWVRFKHACTGRLCRAFEQLWGLGVVMAGRFQRWQPLLFNIIASCLGFLLVRDLFTYGLSSANGRSVSFLSSLNNCFEFRNQNPYVRSPSFKGIGGADMLSRKESVFHVTNRDIPWWWRGHLFLASFWLKFGASTLVSVLLWKRPVILKGPRHIMSFAVSFLLVQLFPGDLLNKTMRNPSIKLLVKSCCALYKMRKLFFVVDTFSAGHHWGLGSWFFMLMVAGITMDGNSMLRRLFNIMSFRGLASCRKEFRDDLVRGSRFVGARVGPLVFVTGALSLTAVARVHARDLPGNTSVAEAVLEQLHWLNKACAVVLFFLYRTDIIRNFFKLQAPTLAWPVASPVLGRAEAPSVPVGMDRAGSPTARRRKQNRWTFDFCEPEPLCLPPPALSANQHTDKGR